jgi:hypothetical protein
VADGRALSRSVELTRARVGSIRVRRRIFKRPLRGSCRTLSRSFATAASLTTADGVRTNISPGAIGNNTLGPMTDTVTPQIP